MTPIFLCALAALREPITIFQPDLPPHPVQIATITCRAAPSGLKKILTRLAKLEDEIAKGGNELDGLLG